MSPFAQLTETIPFLSALSPLTVFLLIVGLMAWTFVLKGFALWFAARNHHVVWFIVLMLINTLGILELAYLLVFRKDKAAVPAPVAETTETT